MIDLLRGDEHLDELIHGGMKLIQSASAPRFSVDAVLLADFCSVDRTAEAVEFGCGTGVISLLLAEKNPALHIRALELMPRMADMAQRSVLLNERTAQIDIICGDISAASKLLGRSSCELLVSNPPYYKNGSGRLNEDELFCAARSESYCSLETLLDSAEAVLAPRGRLCLIHRAVRCGELIGELERRRLHTERIRFIQPERSKPANLVLIEARKHGQADTLVMPPLIIYDEQGCYSPEMEEIYGRDPVSDRHTDR